jgi:hypothetical protein
LVASQFFARGGGQTPVRGGPHTKEKLVVRKVFNREVRKIYLVGVTWNWSGVILDRNTPYNQPGERPWFALMVCELVKEKAFDYSGNVHEGCRSEHQFYLTDLQQWYELRSPMAAMDISFGIDYFWKKIDPLPKEVGEQAVRKWCTEQVVPALED